MLRKVLAVGRKDSERIVMWTLWESLKHILKTSMRCEAKTYLNHWLSSKPLKALLLTGLIGGLVLQTCQCSNDSPYLFLNPVLLCILTNVHYTQSWIRLQCIYCLQSLKPVECFTFHVQSRQGFSSEASCAPFLSDHKLGSTVLGLKINIY